MNLLIKSHQIFFRAAENREQQLRELFNTNKKLKQKFKETLAETTDKLQQELKKVQNENQKIVLENGRLKSELMKHGIK